MRRLIPSRWRETVLRDLGDERTRLGRSRAWRLWHTTRIGVRLRAAELSAHVAVDIRGLLGGWRTDVLLAWRASRRQLGSTLAIVTMLALGIGAATSTFAVFNAVVFQPAPGMTDADALVSVYIRQLNRVNAFTSASFARFDAMRSHAPALAGLAAASDSDYRVAVAPDAPPVSIPGTEVTRDYFQVVGVHPRAGRLMAGSEYEAPDSRVAVISERLWASMFGREAMTVGGAIWINEQRFTVIGITADYRGTDRQFARDLWIPYGARRATSPADRYDDDVSVMVGRLARDATPAVAQDQLRAAFAALGPFQMDGSTYAPTVSRGVDDPLGFLRERLLRIYTILMSGIAMLLLLACANAANLLVARNVSRRRDLSLRGAVGASRVRLMRELVVEAGLMALAAAGLGLGIGRMLLGAFRGERLLSFLPKLERITTDWRVIAVACGAAGATLLLFAVLPAWSASRVDVRDTIAESARTGRRGRSTRAALVAVQVAMAFVLIAGTALMAQTVERLRAASVGFDPRQVMSVSLHPAGAFGAANSTLTAIADRIEAAGAGPSGLLQFALLESVSHEHVRRGDQPAGSGIDTVSMNLRGDTLSTLGVPVIAGRSFTRAESVSNSFTAGGPIMIGESTAHLLFGSAAAAVDQRVAIDFPKAPVSMNVIGVTGDVATSDLRAGKQPTIWAPAIAGGSRIGALIIRTSWTPAMVTDLVRRVAHDVAPTMVTPAAVSVADQIENLLATERVLARLGIVIAGLAALLALFGIHAVVTFIVSERTREFGIRVALGATASRVLGGAVRGVLVACGLGVAGGVMLAAWSSRALADRLYGVGRFDVATFALVTCGLLASALIAALAAARRATRIDPSIALRAD